MDFLSTLNWLAIGQIILIDVLLGGDNAVLIALACRNLPPQLRTKGIIWGTLGAIAMRIALISFAIALWTLPYLKLVGGALLFWIGIKLLSENGGSRQHIKASERLLTAIKTIIIADLVMSIDNVIAIASAAELAGGEHRLLLVTFGILVSIPFIVWGSTLVLKLMERFPVIITLGGALLGYLAGAMMFSDLGWAAWRQVLFPHNEWRLSVHGLGLNLPGLLGAVLVTVIGLWRAKPRASSPCE